MRPLGAIGEGLVELAAGPDSAQVTLGFGGDAANICVMAARLGAPARLAGRIGADAMGDRLLAFWRAQGVDVSGVLRDPGAATGLYLNEPTPSGDHRFTYWRTGSAGSRLEPADLDNEFFTGLGALVITGVTLAVSSTSAATARHAVERARAADTIVAHVLNHRPALGGEPGEQAALARSSDILIASAEDAQAVFGVADVVVLAELLAGGPTELVVSDGPRPAVLATADGCVRQPVPQVAVRNAAGAGDALAAAYLAARLGGLGPSTGLAWGVAAATLSVEREGCASSYPTAEETRELVARLPAHEPGRLRSEAQA